LREKAIKILHVTNMIPE